MKIAIVIPELHKRGGTERCMAELAEALAARGHTLVFFCNRKDPSIVPDARWFRVPMLRWPSLARYISFMFANTIVRSAAIRIHGLRVDLVHSTGPDVLFPTVTTLHCCTAAFASVLREPGLVLDRPSGQTVKRMINSASYWIIALLERHVVRRGARRVIVISNALTDEICDAHGILASRLSIIPNGVNLDEFHPRNRTRSNEIREEFGLAPGQRVVTFVGYNWERKGFGVLVNALSNLRAAQPGLDPYLLAVGGRGRQSYENSVRARLGGQVRFLGARGDVNRILAASNVCVLPSEQEPFGLPVLEAMATGIPAIVSRCSGVAELITDGVDGLLLQDPRDAVELSTKLGQVLGSPDVGREMGDRARQTAEVYSWAEIAKRVEAVYCGLVSGQRAPI